MEAERLAGRLGLTRAGRVPILCPIVAERIGIYGGSFDPVHTGHLLLGRDAVESLALTRLIFVPAAISPHKLDRSPNAPGALRLQMLHAAISGEERFAVAESELHRPGPSFTIDTILALRASLPADSKLFYLIGEDNVPKLHTWHRIDALRRLVQFVVFRREGKAAGPEDAAMPIGDFPVLERRVDVSSTEIRLRVAAGRSIRYFVPEAVAAVIDAHGLYRPPITQPEEGPFPSKLNS